MLFLIILFPSTIIKLDIAFINVSMLLTVKEIAKIIIITDIVATWSFNNNWKKARSGMTLLFDDTATKPLNPIKKTIGIMIKKEIIKLFFNTLLFFAAYTLCQFPWWKRFVAATAIKKVRPAVKLGI